MQVPGHRFARSQGTKWEGKETPERAFNKSKSHFHLIFRWRITCVNKRPSCVLEPKSTSTFLRNKLMKIWPKYFLKIVQIYRCIKRTLLKCNFRVGGEERVSIKHCNAWGFEERDNRDGENYIKELLFMAFSSLLSSPPAMSIFVIKGNWLFPDWVNGGLTKWEFLIEDQVQGCGWYVPEILFWLKLCIWYL